MRIRRLVFTMVMSLMLVTGMMPLTGAAFAAEKTDQDRDKDKVISQLEQYGKRVQNPFSYRSSKNRKKLLKAAEAYPETFDLRDVTDEFGVHHNYVTPVKLQHPFGSCWGFAAIAAAESSLLGSGLAEQDGYDATGADGKKELDLSEKHLVNFVSKAIDDESNPQNGEGMYFVNANATSADRFNNGGMPFYATSLFSSGVGPNLEDRDTSSFSDTDGFYDEIYKYRGRNDYKNYREAADGSWYKFCYSDGDDWDMPERLRFTQSYVLKESYILPGSALEDEDTGGYVYDPAGTEAIKTQLMNKRAVEIAFFADASEPDKDEGRQFISDEWAHYTCEQRVGNHAVTIVGWDDNYPREKFMEGKQPPEDMFPDGQKEGSTGGGNGAWLVKNSWGSGEREFPNRGTGEWGLLQGQDKAPYAATSDVHTGFFWISYYDQSLEMAESLVFDKSNVANQYYLDQHDYMPVSEVVSTEVDKKARIANVFEAEANEQLEQISCETSAPGTEVSYKVYLLQKEFADPEDGVLMAEGTETFEYGGFHKIELPAPVLVQEEQSYSIVISEKAGDDYIINIPTSYGEMIAVQFQMDSWQNGVINENESYISVDGSWADYSDEAVRTALVGEHNYGYVYDNFPIKGYCSMLEEPAAIVASVDELELDRGAEKLVKVTMRSKEASSIGTPEIKWEYAGGDEVFTLERDPNASSKCTVKAGDVPGIGFLKVTASGIGTRAIPVKVEPDCKYTADDIDCAVGESVKISIYDYKGEPFDGVFWYYSDDESVASVSADGVVTGVGEGAASIYARDSSRAEVGLSVFVKNAEGSGGSDADDPDGKDGNDDKDSKDSSASGDTQKTDSGTAAAAKVKNTMTASGKTVKVKYSRLKKKTQKISAKKAFKVKDARGAVTYKVTRYDKKAKKKIKVSKSGKVTVKKGLRKGTYKLKVKITAAGNNSYNAGSRTVTLKVKVKK